MLDKIKALFEYGNDKPRFFPYAKDPTTGQPSVTLYFAYVAFYLSVLSLIALHFWNDLIATTGMSFLFTVLMITFYKLKTLSKAKFDIDDRSIELDSQDEEKK